MSWKMSWRLHRGSSDEVPGLTSQEHSVDVGLWAPRSRRRTDEGDINE